MCLVSIRTATKQQVPSSYPVRSNCHRIMPFVFYFWLQRARSFPRSAASPPARPPARLCTSLPPTAAWFSRLFRRILIGSKVALPEDSAAFRCKASRCTIRFTVPACLPSFLPSFLSISKGFQDGLFNRQRVNV